MSNALRFPSAIPSLVPIHQGKTRDTFKLDHPKHLRLVVATDRISTHNIVHESLIPKKGEVLNALTVFWIEYIIRPQTDVRDHLVASGVEIYDYLESRDDYPPDLHLRAVVVKELEMIPVEFIFRGYLTGSLYDEFYSKGLPNPYGVKIPSGLPLMCKFPNLIFTPTDKSETDEPLDSYQTRAKYRYATMSSLEVYDRIREYLNRRGLELIDSKMEWGLDQAGHVLADEIVTPDSSRFCELPVTPGVTPPWLDKQIFRDEAMRMWDGGPKRPLRFSDEVIERGSQTYLDVFERITGESLLSFQDSHFGF